LFFGCLESRKVASVFVLLAAGKWSDGRKGEVV
jgi:hypothetical protein